MLRSRGQSERGLRRVAAGRGSGAGLHRGAPRGKNAGPDTMEQGGNAMKDLREHPPPELRGRRALGGGVRALGAGEQGARHGELPPWRESVQHWELDASLLATAATKTSHGREGARRVELLGDGNGCAGDGRCPWEGAASLEECSSTMGDDELTARAGEMAEEGRSACLPEEEEEGRGKDAMEGSSAAMELLPLRMYRKQREGAAGGG